MICIGSSCVASICGDGVVDPRAEDCEDGNETAGDGCEPGSCAYTCTDSATCDDGDSCNGNEVCTVENVCQAGTPASEGTPCTSLDVADGVCATGASGIACAPPGCGNGVVDDGEDCDDGRNGDDEDGCTDVCQYTCDADGDCEDGDVCNGVATGAHPQTRLRPDRFAS